MREQVVRVGVHLCGRWGRRKRLDQCRIYQAEVSISMGA